MTALSTTFATRTAHMQSNAVRNFESCESSRHGFAGRWDPSAGEFSAGPDANIDKRRSQPLWFYRYNMTPPKALARYAKSWLAISVPKEWQRTPTRSRL
ncbi:MAG: hypothetical protein R2867_01450 [Caldilineaceae bacterium]